MNLRLTSLACAVALSCSWAGPSEANGRSETIDFSTRSGQFGCNSRIGGGMQPTAEFGFDVDPLAEQREGRMFAKVVIPLGQKKGEASQRRARAECEEQYQLSLQQQRMDMQRQAIELEILKLRLEQMQRPSGTEDW